MKFTVFTLSLTTLVLLTISCSGSSVRLDPSLSEAEQNAVILTDDLLPSGCEITEYEVMEASYPVALRDAEFKKYRDEANKAALDYRTCMTRGLKEAAEGKKRDLETIGTLVNSKVQETEDSGNQYIIVLAKVKEKNRKDKITGIVSVFDASTLQKIEFREITTPVVNNAIMISEATAGTLVENSISGDHAGTGKGDKITEFILSVDPK